MDDEWTINGKNSTKGTRINAENQRVTKADVGRENPSLSAFKTKRESCDSLFLCLIANALYLQRSDYGERERFIP